MKPARQTTRVWDPLIRIGHWTLVITFFAAYLTEDDFLTQHVWAGYVAGVAVCVRVLWGVVGTRHARFADFVRPPAETLAYIRALAAGRAKRHIGHNPAGGAMVVALLLGISGTVVSGLFVYALDEDAGPLSGWVGGQVPPSPAAPSRRATPDINGGHHDRQHDNHDERDEGAFEELWEELHEILANVTLLLVGVHVAGVLFSSYLHKENLIKGMITGRKRPE